jgi:hypothetical protein
MISRVGRTGVALVAVLAATTALLVTTAGVASAAGPVAYTDVGTGDGCRIVKIDIGAGTTTLLPAAESIFACGRDWAMAPDGTLWNIRQDEPGEVAIVQFDATTGAELDGKILTGNFPGAEVIEGGIAFDANGVMLVHIVTNEPGCFGEFVCLYRVDPSTGASTFIGNAVQPETEMFFLTANCAGGLLTSEFSPFLTGVKPGSTGGTTESNVAAQATTTAESAAAATGGSEGWSKVDPQNGLFDQLLSSVNPNNGAVIPKVLLPPNFDLFGIEYDRVTGVLYAIGQALLLDQPGDVTPQQPIAGTEVFTVNTTTGALTAVMDFDDSVGDIPQGLAIGGTCAAEAPLVVTFTG